MANINLEYMKAMVVFVGPVLMLILSTHKWVASASLTAQSQTLQGQACARDNLPTTILLEVGAGLSQSSKSNGGTLKDEDKPAWP